MKLKIVKLMLLAGIAVLFTNCSKEVHVRTSSNIDSYQTIAIAKADFSCEARHNGTLATGKYFITKGQKFGAMDLSRYYIQGDTSLSEKTYFPEGSIALVLLNDANILMTIVPVYLNGKLVMKKDHVFDCWNSGDYCRQSTGNCTKIEGGNFEVKNR